MGQPKTEKELLDFHRTFFWQSEKIIPSSKPEELDKLFEILPADCMHVNDPATIVLKYLDPVTMKKFGVTQDNLQTEGVELLLRGIEEKNMRRNFENIAAFVKQGNPNEVGVLFQHMDLKQTADSDFEWYISFMKLSDKARGLFTLDFNIRFLDKYQHKFMKIIEWDEYVHKNMDRFQDLSPREVEVLTRVAIGESSQEIADRLFLSKYTIDTHRKNIMAKLDISRFVDLVRFAEAFDLV